MSDNPKEVFGEDYFMRGKELGISNFTDFKWLPDLTIPAVLRLVERLGIEQTDTVLDFGCARGFVVKAFRFINIEAYGYDISEWGIANCHPDVKAFVTTALPLPFVDWIIAKDVLEHIRPHILADTVSMFLERARKGILIVVPLCERTGGAYVSDRDNLDSTHIIRWTLCDWLQFLQRSVDDSGLRYTVQGAYKQPGLKEDITKDYLSACGFLTLRRYLP